MAKNAAELFNQKVPEVLTASPDKFKGLNEIFKFVITGDEGGAWTLDTKAVPPTVCEGDGPTKPTCTIEIGLADFQALLGNMMLALQFMSQKKMKIDNPMAAMKLQKILPLLK
jgi:hypothetical protein